MGSKDLGCIVISLPKYEREKFNECSAVIGALIERYGLTSILAMAMAISIYQELTPNPQSSDWGYFEYLAGKG